MRGVNKTFLIGHLGRDPEVRYLADGTAVANFSIATGNTKKEGERWVEADPDWHKIVAWDRLAEVVKEYLHKGSKVYIEGKMQTRKYQAKDGTNRYVTEVRVSDLQLLDSRPAGSGEVVPGEASGAPAEPYKPHHRTQAGGSARPDSGGSKEQGRAAQEQRF